MSTYSFVNESNTFIVYPPSSKKCFISSITGFISCLKNASISSNFIVFINSAFIVILQSSSNSQYTSVAMSLSTFINMETDFVLPSIFINLKIIAFGKNGIFLPSTETSSQYRRYKFVRSIRSCRVLTLELYFINGLARVA